MDKYKSSIIIFVYRMKTRSKERLGNLFKVILEVSDGVRMEFRFLGFWFIVFFLWL